MKIAFLGTSEFAVPALQALVDAGHDVAAVYTRAPKPAGRGQQERKTPVHVLAETLLARVPKLRALLVWDEAVLPYLLMAVLLLATALRTLRAVAT